MDWIQTLMKSYCREPIEERLPPKKMTGYMLSKDVPKDQWFSCQSQSEGHFVITSSGVSGRRWIERLESCNVPIDEDAHSMLSREVFSLPVKISTEVMVLNGRNYASDSMDRLLDAVKQRGLITPNPLVACILRLVLKQEEVSAMGYRAINVMHEPLRDLTGEMSQLALDGTWLTYRFEDDQVCTRSGYVYALPSH